MHGHGTFTVSTSAQYTGQFVAGKKHGKGTYKCEPNSGHFPLAPGRNPAK